MESQQVQAKPQQKIRTHQWKLNFSSNPHKFGLYQPYPDDESESIEENMKKGSIYVHIGQNYKINLKGQYSKQLLVNDETKNRPVLRVEGFQRSIFSQKYSSNIIYQFQIGNDGEWQNDVFQSDFFNPENFAQSILFVARNQQKFRQQESDDIVKTNYDKAIIQNQKTWKEGFLEKNKFYDYNEQDLPQQEFKEILGNQENQNSQTKTIREGILYIYSLESFVFSDLQIQLANHIRQIQNNQNSDINQNSLIGLASALQHIIHTNQNAQFDINQQNNFSVFRTMKMTEDELTQFIQNFQQNGQNIGSVYFRCFVSASRDKKFALNQFFALKQFYEQLKREIQENQENLENLENQENQENKIIVLFEIELNIDKSDQFILLDRKELSDYYQTDQEVVLQDGIRLNLIHAHENLYQFPEQQAEHILYKKIDLVQVDLQ